MMMTAMARLPCKQSSPSQQQRANNFGNSRNSYWDIQARHPTPPYVRNHHRHVDHTGRADDSNVSTRNNSCYYIFNNFYVRTRSIRHYTYVDATQTVPTCRRRRRRREWKRFYTRVKAIPCIWFAVRATPTERNSRGEKKEKLFLLSTYSICKYINAKGRRVFLG